MTKQKREGLPNTEKPTELSFTAKTKKVVAGLIVAGLLGLGGYKICDDWAKKSTFEEVYASIVNDLLVYSLIGQVSGEQRSLTVTQLTNLGNGSGEFELACESGFFSATARIQVGGIFDCWNKERQSLQDQMGSLDQDQLNDIVDVPLGPSAYNQGETSYSFDFYTVFGKLSSVSVNSRSEFADKLENRLCTFAQDNQRDRDVACDQVKYVVSATYKRPDGKNANVAFVLMPKVPMSNQSGDLFLSTDWYIFPVTEVIPGDNLPEGIKVSDLTSRIRSVLEKAGVFNANLSNIGPTLEEKWANKDRKFVDALEGNLKAIHGNLGK